MAEYRKCAYSQTKVTLLGLYYLETESESELQLSDILRGLSVVKLKTHCAEFKLKVSVNKADINYRKSFFLPKSSCHYPWMTLLIEPEMKSAPS